MTRITSWINAWLVYEANRTPNGGVRGEGRIRWLHPVWFLIYVFHPDPMQLAQETMRAKGRASDRQARSAISASIDEMRKDIERHD